MDLFIIRHAWAADRDNGKYPNDALRPLTDDGSKRFKKMVDFLTPSVLKPQLIVTSPMLRCRQTAEILAAALGDKTKLVERKELLPGGDPKRLFAWTGEQAANLQQVAWVGHAPDVGYFAALLIGQDDGWMNFKKGAIASIRCQNSPDFGRGELQWLVTAKVLGCN